MPAGKGWKMMRFDWMSIAGSRSLLTTLAMTVFLWPGVGLAGTHDQDNQERTILPMPQATLAQGVRIPPVDAAVPAKTKTATFALG
jgi:hypothetical protein